MTIVSPSSSPSSEMRSNAANQEAILIQDLVKRFDGQHVDAIAKVHTSITRGTITGLVGPDGAGKTTLLRLLAGLLQPTSGSVSINGLDPFSQSDALHEHVGYMPQKFGLYEDLSVLENLTLYADLRNVTGIAREESFAKLLAFTALAPFTERQAGKLSGGMKQKLGLACALLGTPQVLLLDEPGVGQQPHGQERRIRRYTQVVQAVALAAERGFAGATHSS